MVLFQNTLRIFSLYISCYFKTYMLLWRRFKVHMFMISDYGSSLFPLFQNHR